MSNGIERAYLKAKCLDIFRESEKVQDLIDGLKRTGKEHFPIDERQIENLINYRKGMMYSLEIIGFDTYDQKFFYDGDYMHGDDK